ncbi:MAG: DUF5067 domain-containing protein [Lachnospiraceae bacterium]|nr:DUF5067 domain-containing protein [Lachnospiraceae bacterium]
MAENKKIVRRKLTPEEIKARKKQQKGNKKQGSSIDFSVGDSVLDHNDPAAVNNMNSSPSPQGSGRMDAYNTGAGYQAGPYKTGAGAGYGTDPYKTGAGSSSRNKHVKTSDMTNPAKKFNEDKSKRDAEETGKRKKTSDDKSRDKKLINDLNEEDVAHYSRAYERKQKDKRFKIMSAIILTIEGIVFIGLLCVLIHFVLKLNNKDFDIADAMGKNTSQESSSEGNSGSVNVNNEQFALTCTKVQLTDDIDGNPAAVIYFTFENRTADELSMSEVYVPLVTQEGQSCETFAALSEPPDELYNKDQKISNGASVEACYTVKLVNKTSPLTLTIHDNYNTFSDIGSTEIALQ